MPDDHHRVAFVSREARHNRVIVGESAIAADFGELREQTCHVVEHRRTVVVPRHHDALPGRQA